MKLKQTFRKVRDFIERQQMLDGASGIVLAVSGGADSIVLLEIFTRLREKAKEMRLHVAHLHHGLRESEADEDAEFVRQIAAEFEVACTVESADVRAIAAATSKSIEEAAREARYRFFLRLAAENAYNRIATGHTMNDQAETLLMRLARGTGLRGLRGIRPVVEAHDFQESGVRSLESGVVVKLIRPLLCLSRKEVEEYAQQRGLMFRTDSSNFSLNYTRNRIRHEALKALEAINPQIVERLAQTARLIADEEEALESVTASLLDEAARDAVQPSSYAVQTILRQPVALQRRLIFAAMQRARGQFAIARQRQIQAAHVDAVLDLLHDKASGKRIHLPEGLAAWRDFDRLTFAYDGERGGDEVLRVGDNAEVTFWDFTITILRNQPVSALRDITAKNQAGADWLTVALDEERLPAELLVRERQRGEKCLFAGQREAKKLKQLMIERKVPASERHRWAVVSTPDGQYVWSPQLPPGKDFIPEKTTKRIAILSASKKERGDS